MTDGSLLLEYLRYPFELLAAMLVFVLPNYSLTKRRLGAVLLLLLSLSLLSLFRFLFAVSPSALSSLPPRDFLTGLVMLMSLVSFFIILALASFCMKKIFHISSGDLLFIALASYTLQHLSYLVIGELLAEVLCPYLGEHPLLHALVTIIVLPPIYMLVYRLFKGDIQGAGIGELSRGKVGTLLYLSMLLLLVGQTISNQYLYYISIGNAQLISLLSNIVLCLLILYAQYMTLHSTHLTQEQFILEHLIEERKKQYQIEKDAVDLIHFKSHDLKNQLLALKDSDKKEQSEFYQEAMNIIQNHDQVTNLANETLNTLITQKQFLCQKYQISFSYIMDAPALDFIKKVDLYTILGNALDNAIECVKSHDERRLRQVSLQISTHKQFLLIKVVNPFLGKIAWDKETMMPITSKDNQQFHGFGLKSIQTTLEKYGGWLDIETDNQLFSLSIVVPLPHHV